MHTSRISNRNNIVFLLTHTGYEFSTWMDEKKKNYQNMSKISFTKKTFIWSFDYQIIDLVEHIHTGYMKYFVEWQEMFKFIL